MFIKKYLSFINERLGVPNKIIDSATNLYDLILSHFGDKSLDSSLLTESEYSVDLPIQIEIADLKFNSVKFRVNLVSGLDDGTKVDIISWGVASMPDSTKNYKLYYDKNLIDDIKLFINFAITDETNFTDIYDYIKNERSRTIGILSHELKHVYDKYMLGKVFLEDIVDYSTWSNTRTGFRPIDEFIYYMYFISKTESLVRTSELAGELVTSDISKSEFKEFLNGSSTYENLVDIKGFTYQSLKSKLLSDIDHVRKQFVDLEDETDEEVLDTALEIAYIAIVKSSGKEMKSILRLDDPKLDKMRDLEIKIFGMCKDTEFFNKYLNKIVFNNKEEFFLYCEKKLNFEADKVIRKIIKLYDMCKDDVVNPLMTKINQRVDGKCIVNPKLYDKLVVKPNSKYKTKK
jgi:hypothetical protein